MRENILISLACKFSQSNISNSYFENRWETTTLTAGINRLEPWEYYLVSLATVANGDIFGGLILASVANTPKK